VTRSVGNLDSVAQALLNHEDDAAVKPSGLLSAAKVVVTMIDPEPVLDRLTGLYLHKVRITNRTLLRSQVEFNHSSKDSSFLSPTLAMIQSGPFRISQPAKTGRTTERISLIATISVGSPL
jgi:hypothetical protein